MFHTETHRAEFYLGDTHYEPRRWAHVFADVQISHSQPSVERPDATAETVDHRQIASFDRVSVTFSLIGRGHGFDPLTMRSGWAPDRSQFSFGQIPKRERRIHDRAKSPVSTEHRRLIESVWEQHHLNDVNAGCIHMADFTVPEQHDEKDDVAYQLKHWACPVTGYRWGHKWLVREIPADQLEQLKAILTPTTSR
jgi:hypothetical protein